MHESKGMSEMTMRSVGQSALVPRSHGCSAALESRVGGNSLTARCRIRKMKRPEARHLHNDRPDHLTLPDCRETWRWRHGCGLQGRRYGTGPVRGAQVSSPKLAQGCYRDVTPTTLNYLLAANTSLVNRTLIDRRASESQRRRARC